MTKRPKSLALSDQQVHVPQAAPGLRLERHRHDVNLAIERVLHSGSLILGPETQAFEREFADDLGLPHVVGVASGTDALSLGLRAVGVAPGDNVLVPALSAPATAAAVLNVGAQLNFVDVEQRSRGLDPARLRAAAGKRTSAIIAVHLHGLAAEIVEIAGVARTLGLPLIEDCAQAHGANKDGVRVGCFGDVAAFSFYPTKNLGGIGDGGCVATSQVRLADTVRRLRACGVGASGLCEEPGTNSRLDEIQAAVLRVMLGHLEANNAERRDFARFYNRIFEEIGGSLDISVPQTNVGHVYHQYAITLPRRDEFMRALAQQSVNTAVHYAVPLHHHPAFAKAGSSPQQSYPVAENLARTLVSMPIQPELRQHENAISQAVTSAVRDLEAGGVP